MPIPQNGTSFHFLGCFLSGETLVFFESSDMALASVRRRIRQCCADEKCYRRAGSAQDAGKIAICVVTRAKPVQSVLSRMKNLSKECFGW